MSPDPRAPQSLADMGMRARLLLGPALLPLAAWTHAVLTPLWRRLMGPWLDHLARGHHQASAVRWVVDRCLTAVLLGAVAFASLKAWYAIKDRHPAPLIRRRPRWARKPLASLGRKFFPAVSDRTMWERVRADLELHGPDWKIDFDGPMLRKVSDRQQKFMGLDRVASGAVYSVAASLAWLWWNNVPPVALDDFATATAVEGFVMCGSIWLCSFLVVRSRVALGSVLGLPGSVRESFLLPPFWFAACGLVEVVWWQVGFQGFAYWYVLLPLPLGYFAIWAARRLIWDARARSNLDLGFLRSLVLAYHCLLPKEEPTAGQSTGEGQPPTQERESAEATDPDWQPEPKDLRDYSVYLTQARTNLARYLRHFNPSLAGTDALVAALRPIEAVLDSGAAEALLAKTGTAERLRRIAAIAMSHYLSWNLGEVADTAKKLGVSRQLDLAAMEGRAASPGRPARAVSTE